VSGQLHAPVALPGERASGAHWIEGWVSPTASPDDVEKRKFLTPPSLEASVVQPVASRYADYAVPAPGLDSKEPNPEETQSEAVHREVPKEGAAAKSSGALRKRHGSRKPATGSRRKPKERPRGNCGSRKKLSAAGRKMTRRAGVARRKEHVVRKNQTRNNVARGAPRGRTFGRRRQPKPERKNWIRYRGLRQQLRSKKEFSQTLRETPRRKFVKRIVGSSAGLRKIRDWTLWRGRPPLKLELRLSQRWL
jgi:hypothetical protein